VQDALARGPAAARAALAVELAQTLTDQERGDVHVTDDGQVTFLVERKNAPVSTDEWWDPAAPADDPRFAGRKRGRR
jgi:hypothetical protein